MNHPPYRKPSEAFRKAVTETNDAPFAKGVLSEAEKKRAETYHNIRKAFSLKKERSSAEAYLALWQHPHLPLFDLNHLEQMYLIGKTRPEIIQDLLMLADGMDDFMGSHKFWNTFFMHYPSLNESANKPIALPLIAFFLTPGAIDEMPFFQVKGFYSYVVGSPMFKKDVSKTIKNRKASIRRTYHKSRLWFWQASKESNAHQLFMDEESYRGVSETILKMGKEKDTQLREFNEWLRNHFSLFLISRFRKPILPYYSPVTFYQIMFHVWRANPKNLRAREFYVPFRKEEDLPLDELLREVLGEFRIPQVYLWKLNSLEGIALEWFLHTLQGKPLRYAPGLPFALSTKAEHLLYNTPELQTIGERKDLLQILLLAELMARGADEEMLQNFCNTRMMYHFRLSALIAEGDIYLEAQTKMKKLMDLAVKMVQLNVRGFAIHEVFDYLYAVEFEQQETLPWKGMTRNSLMRRSQEWHIRAAVKQVKRTGSSAYWNEKVPQSMIREFSAEISKKKYRIRQLLKRGEFRLESMAMKHCVETYFLSCKKGLSCIFSLQEFSSDEYLSLVTIEVSEGRIVQARGRHNRPINKLEQSILKKWAEENNDLLSIGEAA